MSDQNHQSHIAIANADPEFTNPISTVYIEFTASILDPNWLTRFTDAMLLVSSVSPLASSDFRSFFRSSCEARVNWPISELF